MNNKLISLLNTLRLHSDNVYRARAFENAINEIQKIPYIINKSSLAQLQNEIKQKKVRHIGVGIITRIEEYCDTGTITEAEHINNEEKYIEELIKIKGVGPQLAREWITKKIYTMSDVKHALAQNKITLTSAQKYGILYYKSLNERIPCAEIKSYTNMLYAKLANLTLHFDVVGSYRRELLTSGDTDILIVPKNKSNIAKIKSIIQEEYFIEFLLQGDERITYLYEWNGKVRQCDILFAASNEYIAALVYFTGSREYCIMLRKQAKRLGYRLNQKGLYHNDVMFTLKTEQDLFKQLQLEYVLPKNRI